MPCQRHCCGAPSADPEMQILRRAEQLRHLTADDDQTNPGQVAADHGVGHVLDQAPQPQQAECHLHQSGQQAEQGEQQQRRIHRRAAAHGLNGKGRRHGSGRCAGCRNQAIGAAEARRNNADRRRSKDPGQRAERDMSGTEDRINGHTESNGRGQGHQHGGETAPEIANGVFQLWQLHQLFMQRWIKAQFCHEASLLSSVRRLL